MTKDDTTSAISALQGLLGDRLSTGESILEIHGRDEAYSAPALPDAVAFPESTEEVSQIMKICSQYQVPVVPFGIALRWKDKSSQLMVGSASTPAA